MAPAAPRGGGAAAAAGLLCAGCLLWAGLPPSAAPGAPGGGAEEVGAVRPAAQIPSAAGAGQSTLLGGIGVLIAALGFGSNYVVIKSYDAGDGMFFQFFMACGVLVTGLVYHLAKGAPPMQPFAMLGGALWGTGNVLCPQIIERLGMGLGLSLWGSLNMLTGWGTARFGLFGLAQQPVTLPGVNLASAIVALLSVVVYAQVKTQTQKPEEGSQPAKEPETPGDGTTYGTSGDARRISFAGGGAALAALGGADDASAAPAAAPGGGSGAGFAGGVGMAVLAGILFGSCFTPAQLVSDQAGADHCAGLASAEACAAVSLDQGRTYCKWDGAACGGPPVDDMVLSQFLGIFLASWVYTVVYGLWKLRRSAEMFVNVPMILPAFLSGVIWAVAQVGWFVANSNLSMAVAFPIICATPNAVGCAWGVFVYNEVVRTKRNIGTLLLGLSMSAAAGVLVAVSK